MVLLRFQIILTLCEHGQNQGKLKFIPESESIANSEYLELKKVSEFFSVNGQIISI